MSGPVSFGEAFRFWLKLGFISFGGPAGQIAIMHHELVERRRWISEGRFLHALNYCMLLPGPEAQQLATYIGWLLHRVRGGLVAGLLFILPSFVILVALSWLYAAYGKVPAIAAFFAGMKPAVVAIVAFAAWRIGRRVLRNVWLLGLAILAFVALAMFGISFPLIVIAAALAGFVGARAAPRSFQTVDPAHAGGDAVIDEHSQTPGHAKLSWGRLAWVLVVGVVLWLAAMALLVAFEGGHGTLSHMAQFFSKAALVTFGGAYAVLPYVNEAAVEQYGWLTAPQMVDGLALGETTPGPLIMVVTFVGYVGAWTHAAAGLPPWLAGLAGATVATYFTFLPSFIFIFAGGPLVEATRGRRLLTAPLAAVTAAVVGVIANLALYFARHVFWPAGLAHPPDWITLAIACGAALALFWFRLGVIPVILACGVAGLIVHL